MKTLYKVKTALFRLLMIAVRMVAAPLEVYGRRHLCFNALDLMGEGELGTAPSLADIMGYSVQRPDAVEGIRQTLYDFNLYPTAGSTQIDFFQLPQGQGLSTAQGNANNPKTLADTNMTGAGSLPNPLAFLMTSIEVIFVPGSVSTANTFAPQVVSTFIAVPVAGTAPISSGAANDVNQVLQSGFLDLTVISKPYLQEAMLRSFPPKTRLDVDCAVATNSATTGSMAIANAQAGGRPYFMNPPILIPPTTNFRVSLRWPVAVSTPSGFNGRIGIRLDGFLYRNAQ